MRLSFSRWKWSWHVKCNGGKPRSETVVWWHCIIVHCNFKPTDVITTPTLSSTQFVVTMRSLCWHTVFSLQHVHKHALGVLKAHCHPRRTRESLSTLLSPSGQSQTQSFLWKGDPLPDDLFLYPPPFGFRGHKGKVEELLKLVSTALYVNFCYLCHVNPHVRCKYSHT